jgi:hypothetical protein
MDSYFFKMRVVSFDIGLRNLAWCDLTVSTEDDSKSVSYHLDHWLVESAVAEDINVNATSLEFFVEPFTKLIQSICIRLNDPTEINYFLIESQPMGHGRSFGGTSMGGSPRNLKTKVLSHILQSILIANGHEASKIHFISPMLKLRECPIPFKERNYKDNKKWAITKTLEIIQDTCDEDLFVGSKRDDLADCFLQGFYVAKLVLNGSMKLTPSEPNLKKGAKKIDAEKIDSEKIDSEKKTVVKRKRKDSNNSKKTKKAKAVDVCSADF